MIGNQVTIFCSLKVVRCLGPGGRGRSVSRKAE